MNVLNDKPYMHSYIFFPGQVFLLEFNPYLSLDFQESVIHRSLKQMCIGYVEQVGRSGH